MNTQHQLVNNSSLKPQSSAGQVGNIQIIVGLSFIMIFLVLLSLCGGILAWTFRFSIVGCFFYLSLFCLVCLNLNLNFIFF